MRTRFLSLEAFVMRTRPQAEADAWVTLLAPVAGLIAGVAKNGFKSQKRFMGALIPVTAAEVLLARRQGVWYLEEAVVTEPHARVKRDPLRYALACYAVEQVLATHPVGPQAADAYPLIAELFDHLEHRAGDLPLVRLSWDLRVMESLGVPPHVADCVACGRDIDAPVPAFHGPSGGLLCDEHAVGQANLLRVSRDALELVDLLMASGVPDEDFPPTVPRIRKEARAMTDAHMAWHMPVELRSKRVLEQLSRVSTRRVRA